MLEVSPYRCTTFVVLRFQQLRVSLCAFIYWLSASVCNERIGLLNVHKVVDPWHYTTSTEVIMHKHACSKGNLLHEIPRCTFWETIATNWIIRLSFEGWVKRDVISWKTMFVKRLASMWLTCGAVRLFVITKAKEGIVQSDEKPLFLNCSWRAQILSTLPLLTFTLCISSSTSFFCS